MLDRHSTIAFQLLRGLGYVALAAMAGAIVYAGVMSLHYWPGIGV
jgi:hypothetical protein